MQWIGPLDGITDIPTGAAFQAAFVVKDDRAILLVPFVVSCRAGDDALPVTALRTGRTVDRDVRIRILLYDDAAYSVFQALLRAAPIIDGQILILSLFDKGGNDPSERGGDEVLDHSVVEDTTAGGPFLPHECGYVVRVAVQC